MGDSVSKTIDYWLPREAHTGTEIIWVHPGIELCFGNRILQHLCYIRSVPFLCFILHTPSFIYKIYCFWFQTNNFIKPEKGKVRLTLSKYGTNYSNELMRNWGKLFLVLSGRVSKDLRRKRYRWLNLRALQSFWEPINPQ